MIFDDTVQIRWNQNNKKYYVEKKYVFTKIGDLFNIKLIDLSSGSHVLVNVMCDVCGNGKMMQYREYCKNIENGNYYSCSRKCGVNKRMNTVLKRYGVNNVSQLEKIKEKKRRTNILNYGEIYMKFFPKYNSNSIKYLDLLSEKLGLLILHALNGGEKKFIRYYVDGYIEKYNICIEWDEKEHNLKKKKNRDNKKDLFLKEKFNCIIFRINEKEFITDIENQTNVIVNSINKIIKDKHGKDIED